MTRREWIVSLPVGMAYFEQGMEANTDQESAKVAVAAQRSFGLRLLRDMAARQPRQNVFVSPLSIFLALDMAEHGAAGTTRTAIRKALALPDLDTAALDASTSALQRTLRSPALAIANALWADRRYTLNGDFVKACETLFNARAAVLDFQNSSAAAEINDWVKAATAGRIADIVNAEEVAKAAVVLTNAVYFEATWRSQFSPSQTQPAPFHLTSGATKSLPMMHQAELTAAYRAGANFEGALLNYREGGMYLYALLPRAGKTPRDVLESLDPDHLVAEPAGFDLDLKIPKFSLDFSATLNEYLLKMGMSAAFDPRQADFSAMGSGRFYISDVFHKTRLEVDEKGTVAAAATAVTFRATAMMQPRPSKTLVFDRPFVVLIGDSQTGALLFAGVIEAP